MEFAIPEAGGTLWSDNMMVPVGSPHLGNAENLMNYYYDPEVAAQVAAYVNYISPVEGAQRGDGEDRPGPRREPVDLPDRRDPRQGQRVPDADARRGGALQRRVPHRDRRMTSAATATGGGGTGAGGAALEIEGVTKAFGSFVAVDDLT